MNTWGEATYKYFEVKIPLISKDTLHAGRADWGMQDPEDYLVQTQSLSCRTCTSLRQRLQQASQQWRHTSCGQSPTRTLSGETWSHTSGTSHPRSCGPSRKQANPRHKKDTAGNSFTIPGEFSPDFLVTDWLPGQTPGDAILQEAASMRSGGASPLSYASSARICTGYKTGSSVLASPSSSAASHPFRHMP